jgi:hypothetical protein
VQDEATWNLNAVLREMANTGLAKKIKDPDGSYPIFIVTETLSLLDDIQYYDWGDSPVWWGRG